MKIIIEVRDFKKYFRSIKVFDGIIVEIFEGVMFIFGFNGGGKSMFFKFVIGVYRLILGEIFVFGERLWNNRSVKECFSVVYDFFVFL